MSLNDAHAFAFNLATTLMAAIIIYKAGDGTLSVMPANEYDGDIAAIVHEIDPFAPLTGATQLAERKSTEISAPGSRFLALYFGCAVVVVEGATVRPCPTETTVMIILAMIASFAAIGLVCWLLFTLAVFALPAFAGVTAGAWAHDTGAGISGAIVVGALAAAVTLAAGHLLITFARPIWLKLIVATAFVAPAAIAGFHATHGIVMHLISSDMWQIAFSVVGAVTVGITAFVRVVGIVATPVSSGRNLARA